VVVAASYDTNELLASLGIALPLTKAARYLFLSEPIHERLLEPLVISQELHFAAKHLADGRVLASDLSAAGDPSVDSTRWRGHVRSVVERIVPILQYVSFPILIEGFYDMTPDSQGIVSAVDGFDGLWVAAGFSGHGFMIAPAVGRGMADLLEGKDAGEAIRQLRASRFGRAVLEMETQVV
jgi:sarcosine oxidase subunit beta